MYTPLTPGSAATSLAFAAALTALLPSALGCGRAKPVPIQELRKTMDQQFIRVAPDYAAGSSKLVDRGLLGMPHPEPDELGRFVLPQPILFHLLAEAIAKQPMDGIPNEVRQKAQPGDFLARLWSIYGPPASGEPSDDFDYVFIDRQTGIVFTAYSGGSGPAYGGGQRYDGPLPPPAKPDGHMKPGPTDARFFAVVQRFERLLEKAALADCLLVDQGDAGLFRYGARAGKPFLEDLGFAESVDYYANLARHGDPAYAEGEIRNLWLAAEESERRRRPGALALARRAFERDLRELEHGTVQPDMWGYAWRALDEQMKVLGLSTPEIRRRLERVREPPPAAAPPRNEEP
jgi:hypothetical protein